MEDWQKTTLLLCGFGLLKELRPSEPFVTEYIMEFKNMTASTVIHEIYPISTYTILASVIIVFLVTDFLRYRPIVILQGFSLVVTWIFLIWGNSIESLIFVQIFYGIAMSADVGYYSYIYGQVAHEHYKKVTSYTYTAVLAGKFLAASLGQILISTELMNFHQLNFITLGAVLSALVLSFSLPKVKQSIYFNRSLYNTISASDKIKSSTGSHVEFAEVSRVPSSSSTTTAAAAHFNNDNSDPINQDCDETEPKFKLNTTAEGSGYQLDNSIRQRIGRAYPILWNDFKQAYSNSYILKWSFFWAIGSAGNWQVMYYVQALWESIEPYTTTHIYNGAVGMILTILSALASISIGHIKIDWKRYGESFLFLISILQGLSLISMSQTKSLWFAYFCYITFRVLFQLTITIASAEVVHGINEDSCGLIFGINTFVAIIIQTCLTIFVADKRGFALDERDQFLVYGNYFLFMGGIFMIVASWICLEKYLANPSTSSTVVGGIRTSRANNISETSVGGDGDR